MKSEMCSIVIVSLLVLVKRDQVRQELDSAMKMRKRREKGDVKLFLEIKNLWQACANLSPAVPFLLRLSPPSFFPLSLSLFLAPSYREPGTGYI